jgi:hypothetical protein
VCVCVCVCACLWLPASMHGYPTARLRVCIIVTSQSIADVPGAHFLCRRAGMQTSGKLRLPRQPSSDARQVNCKPHHHCADEPHPTTAAPSVDGDAVPGDEDVGHTHDHDRRDERECAHSRDDRHCGMGDPGLVDSHHYHYGNDDAQDSSRCASNSSSEMVDNLRFAHLCYDNNDDDDDDAASANAAVEAQLRRDSVDVSDGSQPRISSLHSCHTHTHTHSLSHTHTHTHTHARTHTRTHAHAHAHNTHTHTHPESRSALHRRLQRRRRPHSSSCRRASVSAARARSRLLHNRTVPVRGKRKACRPVRTRASNVLASVSLRGRGCAHARTKWPRHVFPRSIHP